MFLAWYQNLQESMNYKKFERTWKDLIYNEIHLSKFLPISWLQRSIDLIQQTKRYITKMDNRQERKQANASLISEENVGWLLK